VTIKGNEKIGNNIIINETASSCCIDGSTQGPNHISYHIYIYIKAKFLLGETPELRHVSSIGHIRKYLELRHVAF
jgi:hypothetical protein